MPFVLAIGAVGIAAVAALFRPHPAPPAVHAAGETTPFRRVAEQPHVASRAVVYVTGEVEHPGVYSIDSGSRIQGALRAAGGPTARANLLAVNLAEPVADGTEVLVPAKGALPVDSVSRTGAAPAAAFHGSRRHHRASSGGMGHRRGHRSHKTLPAQPVDVNAADAAQFEQLPGVGPGLAERIVAFRDLNGPFRTTDELLDVAGMTDRRYEEILPYVVVR